MGNQGARRTLSLAERLCMTEIRAKNMRIMVTIQCRVGKSLKEEKLNGDAQCSHGLDASPIRLES